MLQPIVFYLFAAITLFSGLMVITQRQPVHSVLFLILAFFNAAGLFVMLGAEFVAMILVIVYVGAVAVLFLFVVMMLDTGMVEVRKASRKYASLGLLVGAVLLVEMFLLFKDWQPAPAAATHANVADPALGNTKALGMLIYTDYLFAFQVAGLILLVAMIGAIVLTHRTRGGVRRQKIAAQNARTRGEAMSIVKVATGEGA